jgi:hypothetical protein
VVTEAQSRHHPPCCFRRDRITAYSASVGPVQVVPFVDDDSGSGASWPASVSVEELEGVDPSSTRRDVVKGPTPKVVRPRSTTHTAVFPTATSARSRPSPHRTDEPEEMARGVVRDAPPALERAYDGFDRGAIVREGHVAQTARTLRTVARSPRRRWVSGALSTENWSTLYVAPARAGSAGRAVPLARNSSLAPRPAYGRE